MAHRSLIWAWPALLLVSASVPVGPPVRGAGIARAASAERPVELDGSVVLFVVDRVSFEDLMAVPEFRALAGQGGAALMTTRVGAGDRTDSSYLTIGAGAIVPDGGVPHLLERTIRAHGGRTCLLPDDRPLPLPPPGPAELLAGGRAGTVHCAGLLGGARESAFGPGDVVVHADGETLRVDEGTAGVGQGVTDKDRRAALRTEGHRLTESLAEVDGRKLVLVVAPLPSRDMDAVGDEVTPLVMAVVDGDAVPPATKPMHALTSDTTRRSGLVSNVDVAPTILGFFGIAVPSDMDGQSIRMTDDPPPFGLHRLHLEQRRIRLPIQLGEVAYVTALAIVGVAALLWLRLRRSLPSRLVRVLGILALGGAAMEIPLLLGGLLPHLDYAWAVPFLVLAVAGLVAAAMVAGQTSVVGPFVFLGWIGLAVVLVDALFGWRGAAVPLLGGTMFDGVRFYGLPNSFIALVLGSALFVASPLSPLPGFAVLVGAGLFAGFPSLGANVGASIVLFTAAGSWWVLRTRRRFGVRETALVAGVVLAGLAVVLAVNRFLPGAPTHATRFVERSGRGLGDVLDAIRHRLGVGAGQVRHVPAALLPLVGLPIVLWTAVTRPNPIDRGLALAGQAWRSVLIALAAAGMAAYVVNDTGVAAAAPVFLYAMTALAYPTYLAARSQDDG